MTPNQSGYSQTQGLKLLEVAVQDFGPIFTINQLKSTDEARRLSDTNFRYLISSLASAGWIDIIKRGTYVAKSPLYAGDIPPFAIAAALIQPIAISHWSALSHHGFTTQTPYMVQASTPNQVITPEMRKGKAYSPRGRAVWRAVGLEFEYIHIKQEKFWGFIQNWVNAWQQVNITDPERTALDLFVRPDIFGGLASAIEILENSLKQIDVNRLVEYALKYNVGAVIKRLGWVLENLSVEENLAPLLVYPVKSIYLLDTNSIRSGSRNSRWQVIDNLSRS